MAGDLIRADFESGQAAKSRSEEGAVLGRLARTCREHGLGDLAERMACLDHWIGHEMRGFEAELTLLPRGAYAVHDCARHLVDLGGKHLRPMCVALAAKLGTGFGAAARDMAVAVELIHNATLLHDDVIDLGEWRRGAPTARVVHGNAASVLGGDWLLVTALERVDRANLPGVLTRTLATLRVLVDAEALQLEQRGKLETTRDDYESIVDGKTASLFRLALFAGAVAGELPAAARVALERYGEHLGKAFQLVDDLLDFNGDPGETGKLLFRDIAEGKLTYPLVLAIERDPALLPLLREAWPGSNGDAPSAETLTAVRDALVATGSLRDCLHEARRHARAAVASLSAIPAGPGRTALLTVADATVSRCG